MNTSDPKTIRWAMDRVDNRNMSASCTADDYVALITLAGEVRRLRAQLGKMWQEEAELSQVAVKSGAAQSPGESK